MSVVLLSFLVTPQSLYSNLQYKVCGVIQVHLNELECREKVFL